MSVVIRLTPEQLSKTLRSHEKTLPKAIADGITKSAHRSRTVLVRKSPVDLGQYKNSWRVTGTGAASAIVNDAPHAGIIEKGARPHGVNRAGIEALTAWALRKLVSGEMASKLKADNTRQYKNQYGTWGARKGRRRSAALEKEAKGIAFAIAAKLKKEGQKGRFIVEGSMPQLVKILQIEVAKQIREALSKKGLL